MADSKHDDFLGIEELESQDDSVPLQTLDRSKFQHSTDPPRSSGRRTTLERRTQFGSIRFDDPLPRKSSSVKRNSVQSPNDKPVSNMFNVFDQQYFGEQVTAIKNNKSADKVTAEADQLGSNVFDEQYFGEHLNGDQVRATTTNISGSPIFEEQYFTSESSNGLSGMKPPPFPQHEADIPSPSVTINGIPSSDDTESSPLLRPSLPFKGEASEPSMPNISPDGSANLFDEQYFDSLATDNSSHVKSSQTRNQEHCTNEESANIFDDQYFDSPATSQTHSSLPQEKVGPDVSSDDLSSTSHSSVRRVKRTADEQKTLGISLQTDYEGVGMNEHVRDVSNGSHTKKYKFGALYPHGNPRRSEKASRLGSSPKGFQKVSENNKKDEREASLALQMERKSEGHDIVLPPPESRQQTLTPREADEAAARGRGSGGGPGRLELPRSAQDAVRRLRLLDRGVMQERPVNLESPEVLLPRLSQGRYDSQGFRIPSAGVPNWQDMSRQDLAKHLSSKIIYDDGDLLAINKPYNLPSHGGPGVKVHVMSGLADQGDLHLLHRLDRYTTGVLLLARQRETALKVQKMFKSHEVIKRYWALTKGVPSPLEGVIDIPLEECQMSSNHYKMVCRAERTNDTRDIVKKGPGSSSHRAVTRYRVVSHHGTAALLELTPLTGVKHQLRAHLAQGLNTPILGDHKYSHLTSLKPQRLFGDMLHRLGMRQEKVRALPLHLHASSLVLPHYDEGRNLFVRAPLPPFFLKHMRRLKLFLPK